MSTEITIYTNHPANVQPAVPDWRMLVVKLRRLRDLADAAGVTMPEPATYAAPTPAPTHEELRDAVKAVLSAGKDPAAASSVQKLLAARTLAEDRQLMADIGPGDALAREIQQIDDARPNIREQMQTRFTEALDVFAEHRDKCGHVADLTKDRTAPALRPIAAELAAIDDAQDQINAVVTLWNALRAPTRALVGRPPSESWIPWAEPSGYQYRASDWGKAERSPWYAYVNDVALSLCGPGDASTERLDRVRRASRAVPLDHIDGGHTGSLSQLKTRGATDYGSARAANERAQRETAQEQARAMWNTTLPERYNHPALP